MDKEFIDIYNIISNEPYNEKNENKFNKERQINKETKIDKAWKYYYDLAKKYYEFHGNVNMSLDFKTKNGYEYDEHGVKLGIWLYEQFIAYRENDFSKVTMEQIKLLEKLNLNLKNIKYVAWLKNYNLAASYYKHHGNLIIPRDFKTKNGYEYDEQGVKLGIWIFTQRQAYKGQGHCKITDEQIKLLEKIEMIWFDENTDKKLQNEIINEQNKKKIEILNRVRSYLNTLDENKIYSKEEINLGFVKKLNK